MATDTKDTKKKAPAASKPAKAPRAPKPAPAVTETRTASPADARNALEKRGTVTGTVVSNKMSKTIVVKVDRRVRHGLYMKYVVRSRRFKAHDEKNEAKIGDLVSLVESRPMSREKRWALQSILRKAGQVIEVSV